MFSVVLFGSSVLEHVWNRNSDLFSRAVSLLHLYKTNCVFYSKLILIHNSGNCFTVCCLETCSNTRHSCSEIRSIEFTLSHYFGVERCISDIKIFCCLILEPDKI